MTRVWNVSNTCPMPRRTCNVSPTFQIRVQCHVGLATCLPRFIYVAIATILYIKCHTTFRKRRYNVAKETWQKPPVWHVSETWRTRGVFAGMAYHWQTDRAQAWHFGWCHEHGTPMANGSGPGLAIWSIPWHYGPETWNLGQNSITFLFIKIIQICKKFLNLEGISSP